MIQQIVFTVIAFVLFVYILLFKLIKKNDTTYLIILGIQAIGIMLNLINIITNKLNGYFYTSILYLLCIIIPIFVFIIEKRNINISEHIRITIAQTYLWFNNKKRAKRVLIDLVTKYESSYLGHRMLAHIYESEGGMRKAIDEYVHVLDIKKNDYKSYYKISVLLNELGKKDEAIQMLRTLLQNKPEVYEASKMLRTNLHRTKGIQKGYRNIYKRAKIQA